MKQMIRNEAYGLVIAYGSNMSNSTREFSPHRPPRPAETPTYTDRMVTQLFMKLITFFVASMFYDVFWEKPQASSPKFLPGHFRVLFPESSNPPGLNLRHIFWGFLAVQKNTTRTVWWHHSSNFSFWWLKHLAWESHTMGLPFIRKQGISFTFFSLIKYDK